MSNSFFYGWDNIKQIEEESGKSVKSIKFSGHVLKIEEVTFYDYVERTDNKGGGMRILLCILGWILSIFTWSTITVLLDLHAFFPFLGGMIIGMSWVLIYYH